MTWQRGLIVAAALAALASAAYLLPTAVASEREGFDHEYAALADVVQRHVRPAGVDYAALQADRVILDRAVAVFASPAAGAEPRWTRDERLAFWINAYNTFTLRVIVDHYPIRSGWFTRQPRNSIRQIDGVWTDITWSAAGRMVTLDDIEHRILRPQFKEPRIHFAINCASVSCPPLAAEPYRARTLNGQLDDAARRYLASAEGLQIADDTLRVSSIFKWYGDDFVDQYAPLVPGERDAKERGVLGVVVKYGPPPAAARAKTSAPTIRFLDYNWSLNEAPK